MTCQIRAAEWAPLLSLEQRDGTNACPLYYARSANDLFGCDVEPQAYAVPSAIRDIVTQRGFVTTQVVNMAAHSCRL